MTDSDDLLDLSRLDVGDEVRVYYRSQRSGNEVERSGTVTAAIETDDGGHVVRIHDEKRDCYKHAFVGLFRATLTSGDVAIAAASLTLEAEPPNGGDPPKLGEYYTVRFECARKSTLGVVNRVVKLGGRNIVISGGDDS